MKFSIRIVDRDGEEHTYTESFGPQATVWDCARYIHVQMLASDYFGHVASDTIQLEINVLVS